MMSQRYVVKLNRCCEEDRTINDSREEVKKKKKTREEEFTQEKNRKDLVVLDKKNQNYNLQCIISMIKSNPLSTAYAIGN